MDNSILRESIRNDKNTVHLLGQEISVEQVTLKIRHFEELSNGFTPPFTPFEGELPDE